MKMHLGVMDIPYTEAPAMPKRVPKARPGRQRKRAPKASASPQPVTTGDVAGFLESKYQVIGHFVGAHEAEIVQAIDESLMGAIESRLMGSAPNDPFAAATSQIEGMFRSFLDNDEMASLGVAGVPTAAALRGFNPRLTQPYARRAPRPSFIASGLYQKSFKAWVAD